MEETTLRMSWAAKERIQLLKVRGPDVLEVFSNIPPQIMNMAGKQVNWWDKSAEKNVRPGSAHGQIFRRDL